VIISIPVDSEKLEYGSYEPTAPEQAPRNPAEGFKQYRLPEDQAMKPARMEVHEATDVRGETPARISLLGRNRTTLKTFSLPREDV
jgi:anaphase-promoting complex subunit 4